MSDERVIALRPLQVPRASDVLSSSLRDLILSGELVVGEALPSERELIAQTRMSRATVREALRTLESQGFVEMRTGRAGGAFARRPGSGAVEQSVRFAIQGDRSTEAQLRETRHAVEPACAALAAKYRTDEDMRLIEMATIALERAAASGSAEAFVLAKLDWHLAVAAASHNNLLVGFFNALARSIHEMTDAGDLSEVLIAQTAADHTPIVDAIRRRDASAAEHLMRLHVTSGRNQG